MLHATTLRFTTLAVIGSMMLSSCATTADGRLTQAQGTGIGAILGGLAGAGLGALAGGGSNIGRYAAIGAAMGAAGGFAYGTSVAQKKASYANQEDFLAYAIGEAEKRNADAAAYNRKLEGEVNALEQRARSQPAAPNEQKKLKLELDGRLASNQKQDTKLAAQIKDLNEAAQGTSGRNASSLRSEISKLEAKKSALQKYNQRLAASKGRLSV